MNVDKGSRKNRSVTLDKLLALMVEPRSLCANVATDRGICRKSADLLGGPSEGWRTILTGLFP